VVGFSNSSTSTHYTYEAKQLKTLKIVLPAALIVLCFSTKAFAVPAPEINPADGVSALALLGGVAMIFRGRLKR
jgi:hypothetical protein